MKITIDFEKDTIIIESEVQKTTMRKCMLKEKETAIFNALDLQCIDMKDFKNELKQTLKDIGFPNINI